METLNNLARQNEILRAQLEVFRTHFSSPLLLQSEILGVRGGDQLLCPTAGFRRVLQALLEPANLAIHCLGEDGAAWVDEHAGVLVQPDERLAANLASDFPGKLVVNTPPEQFLALLPGRSVDRIVIHHKDICPQGEGTAAGEGFGSAGMLLRLFQRVGSSLGQAARVARRQVVLSVATDPGYPLRSLQRSNSPQSVFPSDAAAVYPSLDWSKAIVVGNIGDESDCEPAIRELAIVLNPGDRTTYGLRVVVLSSEALEFRFSRNDIIICDVDVAASQFVANGLPVRNIIVVPLKLLRTVLSLPLEILRSSVMNFSFLEGYLRTVSDIVTIGADANVVVNELTSRIVSLHEPARETAEER